jgi:hypothetical protein
MRILIVITLLSINYALYGQELIQLVGLDVDHTAFANASYGVMGNSDISEDKEAYKPYKTLGIYRNGNTVRIAMLDFLLIPRMKGFSYATLNVVETDYDEDADYGMPMTQGMYTLEDSKIKPIFFDSRADIEQFMEGLYPSFADALVVDFEKFSFINSKFYTTTGFDSYVHGGATWFNGDEKINIYPLDWNNGALSNRVSDCLSNAIKNEILIDAVRNVEGYISSDEVLDKDFMLPWSSSIDEFQNVFFDFRFLDNGIGILPFSQLQSNSSRSFFKEGHMIENSDIYKLFNVKKPKYTDVVIIYSPDNSTRTEFVDNEISVYDTKTNTLLKKVELDFNKVVMSEFARGKYARIWLQEFEN